MAETLNNRPEDEVHYTETEAGLEVIADRDGKNLAKEAIRRYDAHRKDAEQADEHGRAYAQTHAKATILRNTANALRDAGIKDDPSITSIRDVAEQENRETGNKSERAADIRDAGTYRDNQHYNQNKAGYQQMAIEDANAAGHDINFGGEHYPAQVEKPKEPAA